MQSASILQKSLIDELGLGSLPQEKQDELMVKMGEVILKRVYLETMESLSEADREEFGKMLDAKAEPEKIEEFLKGKIKDYDEVLKKIVEKFKEEMMGDAGKFDAKYEDK
jgi:hypothetical protein